MAAFGWETTAQDVLKEYGGNVKGKTILITGATASSLGAQTALALAGAGPARLILTGRSESKVQPVIDEIKGINPEIKVTYVGVDLSSIADVRKGAAQINNAVDHVDILVNNAGIMAIKEYTKSVDNIELQFATNHVGHFLLTNLILGKIVKAGKGARIVNVTSDGHRLAPFRGDDYNFNDGKDYHAWSGYGQSKTANILFTRYLADALAPKGVLAFAVHPGVIWGTGLGGHLSLEDIQPEILDSISMKHTGRVFRSDDVDGSNDFKDFKSKDQGIATTLVAALDPTIEKDSGAYLDNGRVVPERPYAKEPATVEKLWTVSEGLVGEKFDLKTL